MPENNDSKNKNLIALVVFLVVCGYSFFNNQDKVDLSFSIKTDQMHLNLDCGFQKNNSKLSILKIQRCIVKELMARMSSKLKDFYSKDKTVSKICWQKKYPMMWVRKYEQIYVDVLRFILWYLLNEEEILVFGAGWGI